MHPIRYFSLEQPRKASITRRIETVYRILRTLQRRAENFFPPSSLPNGAHAKNISLNGSNVAADRWQVSRKIKYFVSVFHSARIDEINHVAYCVRFYWRRRERALTLRVSIEFRLLVLLRTSISHDEVMDVVVGVGIPGLKGEHVSVRWCVQLDDRLHW